MRLVRLLIALAAAAPAIPAPALAAPADEAMKAAIIYNFTRFSTWGPDRFAGAASPVVLCVSAADPVASELAKLEGRPVGSRKLHIRRSQSFDRGCHAAFLGASAASPTDLAGLSRQGVLTIGESRDFARTGAIALVRVGRQIRFEINNKVARATGVEISSKLLRLAIAVR